MRPEFGRCLAASAAPGLDCRGICGPRRRFDDAELDVCGGVRHRVGGVAGCSGNNAVGPADPGPAGPGPAEPTDPTDPADPAPDGGTAFDAALERASMAQSEAERLVEAAEAAAGDVGTDEARTAAQAAIKAARDALAKAVADARALVALAQGDANLRGRAEDRIGKATASQTAGEARLAAGEAGIAAAQAATQWSARPSIGRAAVPAFPEVRAVRAIRTNAAGTAHSPDIVDADSFPAVQYEQGKVLISDGEAASGDLLRMRGFFPLYIHNLQKDFRNDDLSSLDYGEHSKLFGGLRITPTGLVVSYGGHRGGGIDMRRRVGTGAVSTGRPQHLTWNALDTRGWDLTLSFGEPSVSPEGNGEVHWAARLMPDPGQIADGAPADTRGRLLVDGRPSPVGTYTVWLSNHADVETNLEPVEGSSYPGGSYPDDDDNSFLKYAAYGMMTFQAWEEQFDYTSFGWNRDDRVNIFHLGYDAFANEDGRRTTDIGEAVSDGRFTGLTIGFELDNISRGGLNATSGIDLRLSKRLRGEVELTATISRTASDNSIEGKIRNLEVWDSRGYWKDYANISGDIALGSGSIDAKGEYRGTITGVTGFGDGQYFGNFYGPVLDLETAGAWFLDGTNQGADAVRKAAMGSFGAKPALAE